ncbi:hypothetical protein BDV36DRAFT_216522 [Aspergillus pseudocaelatus]|uniref:Magnesium transporter NIPA-domain-containing protein n=1 Tax=Aspergillus pseudocaelatus TaxID=1825620 RepID=A0ABQ6WFN6_9EURO|nr:hypothetical protein BDV36DRAFT_216522 [Aspergillus pseudocaelatus]
MGNLGDLSPQGSVAVGVVVGLVSTSLQAIGLTLQRKSHILEDEKHPYDLRRPPYKRRRWQLGMLMFVISNIVGSTIQITTLPLPVLSTLQASGLVFNTVFATLILGEAFTRYSLIGTILVCIGAILIATFGAIGEPAHTLDQLLELLQRWNFILWMAGTAVLVLVILLGSRLLKYFASPFRSKHSSSRHPYVPHLQLTQGRSRLIRGLCCGLVSGILSAHALLLAKSAVELLVRTVVDRVNQFNRWQSWVILIAMITLSLTQLFYLHRGLKLCSTSVLYPFVFCIYNIIAILDGLIYFRQMSQLTGLHAGLIALGTLVLLSGVMCLSWRLEVIDSHAAVTVVGPSQTALGPGMAVVEEHPRSSLELGLEDEEDQAGEHEPLLWKASHRRASHRRTPSLPVLTPQGSSADMDPASIWAELDESDFDYADPDSRTPLLKRLSADPFQTRPRGKTKSVTLKDASLRGQRHSSTSPLSHQTWSPRKVRPSSFQPGHQRRTSAPTPDNCRAPQKRRTYAGGSSFFDISGLGYGTQDNRSDTPSSREPPPPPLPTDTDATPLAGTSSGALGTAWQTGLRYLSRLTGGQRRSDQRTHDDPKHNPDTHTDR